MDSLLEETIKDSPVFRESLNTFDEDVDELIKWFETLQRSFKQFSDELFKANELSSSAIQKLLGGPLNITMESNNVREIRVMADSLQSTYSLRAKLVDDLIESVTTPLLTFINKDIKEIKDSRRVLDRIMERYDSTIFSFSKLSKSKEQSALKEDAFQLYEARKIYIKNTLDITIKVALFKQNAEIFMSEVITSCLIAHSEFFNKANDVFNGIKPTVESLKSKLDNSKTKIIATEKMANLRKKQLEEEYISRSKPTSTADALSTTVTIGMSKSVSQYQFSPLKDKDTQGKEGYLFKRSQQNGLLPSWSRKYVYFKDAGFSWSITTRKGGKTTLSTSEPINFLLCQIRMWTKEDRRFTFEIYTHKKSFVLQAENEDDLNSWISTFNAIKTKCAAKGSIFTEGEINGGEDEIENDDDEDDVPGAPKVAETVCDNSAQTTLKYSDVSMEKKNLELHNLLKSVPSQDFLIDLFGCALQKDIAIQGRMFLTQARICFYSNILGFVTVLVIEFSDVTQITRKNTSFYNSIVITSKDGVQNVFKTFLKEDMNFYDTLKVLWANVTSNQPLELQDLYDIIKKRSQKDSSANETGTTNEATEESGVFDLIIGDLKAKSEPELTGDFVAPTAEVLCGCEDHLEKKEQEIVFNVSAKKLYVMIFGKNNAELTPVSEKHHKKRGNTNVIMGAWSTDEKNSDNQWYINLTKQQKQYVYHTSK